MATESITVTKTALLVKTTKGSEKKWSEMFTMNRCHDLQLSLDIDKYNNEFKRTFNLYQRQQNQTERLWTRKHEIWHQDDFIFRNDLLKQLKPITKHFKHIHSLSSCEDQNKDDEILNDNDEVKVLSLKRSSVQELPTLQRIKNFSNIRHFQDLNNEKPRRPKTVLSKLVCPKVLRQYKPRLDSHQYAPFLHITQRFLKNKPQLIEKGIDNYEKQKQQKKYFQNLIETEQERTRLAAIKFGQELLNENNDDYYY